MNSVSDFFDVIARLEADARDLFDHAIAAVLPDDLVARAMAEGALSGTDERGGLILLACGKAAASMASSVVSRCNWKPSRGAVTAPHSIPSDMSISGLEFMNSAHPVPDAASEAAASRALELAQSAGEGDTVLVLLSGGGSSMWALPDDGLTLDHIGETTAFLLQAGADIHSLNAVRKHLSGFKGGRLAAAAAPARVVTLIISDVVGDDPSTIASGPTVPDPTTFAQALEILDRFGGRSSYSDDVVGHLEAGSRGERRETPKPGDALFARNRVEIIGSNRDAIEGAARRARSLGYEVVVHSEPVVGEAREAGRQLVRAIEGRQTARPLCMIWGGETTVTVMGRGRGGRNQELALSAAIELASEDRPVVLLSGGTDGVDGPTDAAGAFVSPMTAVRAGAAGVAAADYLADNNSNEFFNRSGGLIRTGPTGTNVMDLQIALFAAPGP
jgi:hydroxypyruvate reductase